MSALGIWRDFERIPEGSLGFYRVSQCFFTRGFGAQAGPTGAEALQNEPAGFKVFFGV